jgi:hypothetical protein
VRTSSALLLVVASLAAPGLARADSSPPVITHVRLERAPIGTALVVRAKIDDDSAIFAPSVSVRPVGKSGYDNLAMTLAGDFYEATIPAEQVTADLEYFIEAFDEHGNGPAREGAPESPIRVVVFDPGAVPPPPPPPPPPPDGAVVVPVDPGEDRDDPGVAGAWWFWLIVGAAVAGAGTAAYLIARPPGLVDSVDVRVMGPDPGADLP